MSSQTQTAGIILAAGASVRFGQLKQLIRLRGKYLVEWVLDAALKSRLDIVVLVLGHEYQSILQESTPSPIGGRDQPQIS